jgi:hypothetical protein
MSPEDAYVQLLGDFRRRGYHVSRRMIGGADTIVVANNPEVVSGIMVYRQSVQLHQSSEGQWHTMVSGITLPWDQSLDALRVFVFDLMWSEDAYVSEQRRRLRSAGGSV